MDLHDKPCSNDKFWASSFVSDLIEKGSLTPCDETNDEFDRKDQLPAYYDPEKFKRGQRLFHRHIFAMLFSKIIGLVTILSVPDLACVLKYTGMSDDPQTAYKRYLITVFHMYIWYKEDFSPESTLWKSIEKVKFKHNRASRQSCTKTCIFISQKNMALTQFGFMGYAVWKSKMLGIYGAKKEDFEGFIHIWRVIGHLMGIEERFNICRESVDETKEICKELASRIFKPEIQKKREDFLTLSYALLNGMWCMMPFLEYKTFIHLSDIFVTTSSKNDKNDNEIKETDFKLTLFQRYYAQLILFVLSMLRFNVFRVFQQWVMYMSIWLMKNFPFLAYYKFGKSNSHVQVFN